MTLILEVEYLSGVSFAAIGPDSEAPDWPPQPDRNFSALVAAWAARGRDEREAEALRWLENLRVPRLLASGAEPRTTPKVYVPPNDYETPKGELQKLKWYREFLSKGISPNKDADLKPWHRAWSVMPTQRKRLSLKERSFPAVRPHDPIIRLCWQETKPDDATFSALETLARDTAYVGHSASLTRCRFLLDQDMSGLGEAGLPERRVYRGRFDELCQNFEAGRRPLPGTRVAPAPEAERKQANIFSGRWLILEHVAGDMPDIRACGIVAKTLRDALLGGYSRIGPGKAIPEIVSGHAPDGKPSRAPHLAVVPLAFTGFPHADGHMMGFALVPPRDSTILDDENFRRALRRLAPVDEDYGRRILTLTPKAGMPSGDAFSIKLSPTFEVPANKRSLDPALYIRPARTFATVTPIVFDRHLKAKGAARQEEIATQIAAACRNVGLPEPEAVVADKHSSIEGVPAAYPSAKSPPWMRWRQPPSLASRQLTHAVIRFAETVEGPAILGAGRFMGLGLCRPLDAERR